MNDSPHTGSGGLAWRWLVLASALLLVSGLHAEDKPALPADLRQIPGDQGLVITFQVQKLLANPLFKELLPQALKSLEYFDAGLNKDWLGVPPESVDRMTLLPEMQAIIVHTNKAFDREQVLGTLGGEVLTEEIAGKTLHFAASKRSRSSRALWLVNEQVFVKGDKDYLPRLVEHLAKKGTEGPLAGALALAPEHDVTIAIDPAAMIRQGFGEPERVITAKPPPKDKGTKKPPPPERKPQEKKKPLPPDQVAFDDEPPAKGAPLEKEAAGPSLDDVLRELPPEALAFKPILQAKALVLTFDFGEPSRLGVRLSYASKDLAADGETALRTAIYVARQLLHSRHFTELAAMGPALTAKLVPLLRQLDQDLRAATIRTEGQVVTAEARLRTDPAVLAEVAGQLREQGKRNTSANNLKQMGYAMDNYLVSYRYFAPQAITDKDGKPLLSWRVAILPFIEQNPLYNQFKLDEPWDSPNNKKLLAKMPRIYASPGRQPRGPYATFYQVFTGPKSLFPTADAKVTYRNIPDGLSNTWMIVEAGEAVPWTKPEDIAYDADKAVPKLGGIFPEGFHALYCDHRVEFIKKTVKDAVLHRLINPADGQVIPYGEVPTIPPRGEAGPRRTTGKPDVGTQPKEIKKDFERPKLPPKDDRPPGLEPLPRPRPRDKD